jgi:hypothetical protein
MVCIPQVLHCALSCAGGLGETILNYPYHFKPTVETHVAKQLPSQLDSTVPPPHPPPYHAPTTHPSILTTHVMPPPPPHKHPPNLCRCWTLSPDMTALLDNKARFSEYAESLGLQMPAHHVVASPEHLRKLNNNQNVSPSRTGIFCSALQHTARYVLHGVVWYCIAGDSTHSKGCQCRQTVRCAPSSASS